jgi:uncharacterized protein
MKQLPIIPDTVIDPAKEIHFFQSSLGLHLFVVDGSRIFDIESNDIYKKNNLLLSSILDTFSKEDLLNLLNLFSKNGQNRRRINENPLTPPPLSSLSLNVAQACNMSCGYCYADSGKFGGSSRMMSVEVAKESVNRLIAESSPGSDLVLGYMGGEPLLNRTVIHEITRYATNTAKQNGHRIRFSLTTNGTLVEKEDAKLFNEFPFTISLSIDGDRQVNNITRTMNDGSSSYDHIISTLDIFNNYGRPNHLAARVTVTPKTGTLLPILNHLIKLGFDEVGFAAVLVSPIPTLAFTSNDFKVFLKNMIDCGKKALEMIKEGHPYPFGNFETAMQEIHLGNHRPYPCGAGAGYLSTNAEGNLFACHRLIDDPKFAMGNVREGTDFKARSVHLANMHVDLMDPCRNCWARYLCGGGCYHEVAKRGRIACDYIRGWLDFCLAAYAELSSLKSNYFNNIDKVTKTLSSTTVVSMEQ